MKDKTTSVRQQNFAFLKQDSARLQVLLFWCLFCALSIGSTAVVGCADENSIKKAETTAPQNKPKVSFLSDQVQGREIPTASWRYENVDSLDTSRKYRPSDLGLGYIPGERDYLLGHIHNFKLRNESAGRLTISEARTESWGPHVKIVSKQKADAPDFHRYELLPYTLQPGEEIEVAVGFDHTKVSPGEHRETIRLVGKNQWDTLAQIEISANIKGPVSFTPNVMNFGRIPWGSGAWRELEVRMPKKISNRVFDNAKLVLRSSNPHVKVKFLRPTKLVSEFTVEGNAITIKRDLVEDIDLKVHVYLSKEAPVGKIKGILKLYYDDAPNLLIFSTIEVPLSGEIVKSVAE